MTSIKMNVTIEVNTTTCNELGSNGKEVTLYQSTATLLGQEIATVSYHEGFKSEASAIRELKLRIKNNLDTDSSESDDASNWIG